MLSTVRLNRVLEHAWADLTVTVEAGCTIAELQRTLEKHGQRLAVDPLWPERLVGLYEELLPPMPRTRD